MDSNVIENRLKSLKGAYDRLENFFDDLGDTLPEGIKRTIKDSVLGDDELREFMHGIENRRTPRIMTIGRTGIGKSSLINALCGGYVAEVSDYRSCTAEIEFHTIEDDDGRVLMEVMDSRGFSENTALKDSSAEENLIQDIIDFAPDAVLLVLSSVRRDYSISEDIDFLIKAQKAYSDYYSQTLPIIAVINRTDSVPPIRELFADQYSEKKKVSISKIVSEYRSTFRNKKLRFNAVIAVSSYIEWKLDDGTDEGVLLTVEDIRNLTDEERRRIIIGLDYRYQIEELRDAIDEAIESYEARMGFRMALKLDELVLKLSKKITTIFATISATVALTPIPVSDIAVLVPLQAVLVMMIAILAGREIDYKAAKEFVVGLGGVAAIGYACRLLAQQVAKFANEVVPGAGSILSSGIASSGTKAIGEAAIGYYLQDKDFEQLKMEAKEKIEGAV